MKKINFTNHFFDQKKTVVKLFLTINLVLCLPSCAFLTSNPIEKPVEEPIEITQVVGIGMIQPKDYLLTLNSKTQGIIQAIYHDVNDHVKKDQIILHLDDKTQKAALESSEQRLKTQVSTIKTTEEQIDLMEIRKKNIKKNYERDQTLFAKNIISQQAFDNSETAYLEANENLEIAKQNLKVQQQRKNELEQDIKYQTELLEQTRIRAPLSGKIAALDVHLGENLRPDQALGIFVPDGPWMAVTEVDEQFADRIQEGMQAYIRPQGLETELSKGTVTLVAPSLRKKTLFLDSSSTMNDRRVREIHILLADTSQVLIGQKVESVILLDQEKIAKDNTSVN